MNKPEQLKSKDSDKSATSGTTAGSGTVSQKQEPMPVAPVKPGFPSPTAPAGKQPKGGKLPSGKLLAALVVGVLLAGGGFWLGKVTTDPTISDAYVALEATSRTAELDRDVYGAQTRALQGKVASLEKEIEEREDSVSGREAALTTAEAALKTQEEGLTKREAAVSGTEKKQAANTVSDGTWVVGVDIEPGSYKAKSDVGSRCYWGIYASGSNGDDIIANDIPGGGLPTVTLAAGQDFKSSRCGSWTRQ